MRPTRRGCVTNIGALGSVKTNIGHLDAGAGVAGVIKAVLALKHQQIPPSINYRKPNPQIDFANSPFYVNATLADWPATEAPRRAAVSSFGLGGTNAHIILEEAPPAAAPAPSALARQLLLLSARSDTALDAATVNLGAHLNAHPAANLADVAYTLQTGRRHFAQRRFLVAESVGDAAPVLADADPKRLVSKSPNQMASPEAIVYMFPGGGAQHVDMARGLYVQEPTFRATVDECFALLRNILDVDLKRLLYPAVGESTTDAAVTDEFTIGEAQANGLERPSLALPALFTIEYALAKLWQSWGIQPTAMIGHSMGEYTAACLAGVVSLADALAIVTKRGQLFETLAAGGMLSVPLAAADVLAHAQTLDDGGADLSMAAINKVNQCVMSGTVAAIDQLADALTAADVKSTKLRIAVAAHSTLVEPILAPFHAFLQTITFHPPTIPYVSNVSGTWITRRRGDRPRLLVPTSAPDRALCRRTAHPLCPAQSPPP